MKKLLVTGASGFLGWHIVQRLKTTWETYGIFLKHAVKTSGCTFMRCDLTRYADVKGLFGRIRPDAVIHAAAMSDPNYCQQNQPETDKINLDAAELIAGLCAEHEIPCLFTSSDLVFDGLQPPYCEIDPVSPINYYGEQKVLAEQAMRKRYPRTVICRMPLMFGDSGPAMTKSLQPMLKAMASGVALNLFVDEYRTPISGRDAAAGLVIALERMPDILHLGGGERVSRYEFGRMVAGTFNLSNAVLTPRRLADHDMPAPRPPDISFDSSKARSFGFHPGSLQSELKYLNGIIGV